MPYHTIYKGYTIWHSDDAGYRLPWTASRPGELPLAANTLKGIKTLINDQLAKDQPAPLPTRLATYHHGANQ